MFVNKLLKLVKKFISQDFKHSFLKFLINLFSKNNNLVAMIIFEHGFNRILNFKATLLKIFRIDSRRFFLLLIFFV